MLKEQIILSRDLGQDALSQTCCGPTSLSQTGLTWRKRPKLILFNPLHRSALSLTKTMHHMLMVHFKNDVWVKIGFYPEWQFIVLHVKVVLRRRWCPFISLSVKRSNWLYVNEKPYMGCPLFTGPGLAGTDTAVDKQGQHMIAGYFRQLASSYLSRL